MIHSSRPASDPPRIPTARALVERAQRLAAERHGPPTTLHLAQAALEVPHALARCLHEAGVRVYGLRRGRITHEPEGIFERVQSRARRLAVARGEGEVSATHCLAAALTEPQSALAHYALSMYIDPGALAAALIQLAPSALVAQGPAVAVAAAPVAQALEALSGRRAGVTQAATLPGLVAPSKASQGLPGASRGGSVVSRARLSPVDARVVGPLPGTGAGTSAGSPDPAGGVRTAARGGTRGGAKAVKTRGEPVRAEARIPTGLPTVLERWAVSAEASALVGRTTELARLRDALGRREGRGALLVGMPGVGRRTVATRLGPLPGTTLVHLRHPEFAARLRGDEAEALRGIGATLGRHRAGVTLILDPVAAWLSPRETPDEVVAELRSLLVAGALPWLGVATPEECRRLVEQEPWIERAAVRVELEELGPEEVLSVVLARCPSLSEHHGLGLDDAVARRAVSLSDRYLGGRPQPDRALTVLDLACARARRAGLPELGGDTVAEVVAELAAMPLGRVAATDQERLIRLEEHLAARVVGHREPLGRIAHVVRRNAVGFRGPRPMGTFLLLGPTGVGKTETAKAMAELLFPGAGGMSRFDMAEYAEGHAVARLIGAPPGYVGYADGGQLTEAVRRRPYQLVLLDEIEKAHRDVLEALLGLLDEGRLTDGRGRTVDFRNTVVVMTSNLGAGLYADARGGRRIGFDPGAAGAHEPDRSEAVLAAARAAMPPELWNRIDEPLVFAPLDRPEVAEVARRLLADSGARLHAEQRIALRVDGSVVDFLIAQGGYDPSLGARPMRRAIARWVEAPLAEAVLRGELRRGDAITLVARDGAVRWETQA